MAVVVLCMLRSFYRLLGLEKERCYLVDWPNDYLPKGIERHNIDESKLGVKKSDDIFLTPFQNKISTLKSLLFQLYRQNGQ